MMLKRVARLPLWLAELFSGTKSFVANPLIGSRRLNRWGCMSDESRWRMG
ncbi:hypothetical protein A8U91_00976 [Halomonas elongata]|uniref:Uncharacterized protein n=1 Tax=Halomonas elongata TaxID=2746 RepID=A0A1B8P360_HALEL|nr:hypothetical protein [Halomonas elongata]OBX36633.1 hypothetical protein A8U91_00976 [Halomonas elongata]